MIFIIPTDTCLGIWCAFDDIKSYHRIYEIKKRELSKPLSIMIEGFDWLADNTSLTDEQIDFLENYPKPFTIITQSPRLKMILELDQEDFEYKNKENYKKFAFRVAHNNIQHQLISEVGPLFLTSANISGEKEIYDTQEARKQFTNFTKEITYIPENYSWDIQAPSDIFEFVDDSLELNYIRKS